MQGLFLTKGNRALLRVSFHILNVKRELSMSQRSGSWVQILTLYWRFLACPGFLLEFFTSLRMKTVTAWWQGEGQADEQVWRQDREKGRLLSVAALTIQQLCSTRVDSSL